ncbi:MAG: hypothetical protein ACOVNL_02515 [Prochlorococcaceae cyanobacterium]
MEEANCQRASELLEQSGLQVLQFWDQRSQRSFGKPFAELTPAEQMRLSQVVERMEQAKGGTVIPRLLRVWNGSTHAVLPTRCGGLSVSSLPSP